MSCTAGRPLPTGRLTDGEVTRFGLWISVAGLVYLSFASHALVVVLTIASWIVYVVIYTPLKSRSAWQTLFGAGAGAMPVLIGAAVAEAPISPVALSLFGVLYLWQLPHAMSVAWLYRHDFASADMKPTTVVDSSGATAGTLAVLGAAALIPVSLIPPVLSLAPWQHAAVASLLGGGYLACAVDFLRDRNDVSARRLLRASLVYLPGLLLTLTLLGRRCL
jgi:protoheme IX farnesyltransferase